MEKDRCRCGNLVPRQIEFEQHGGTCRACARERQEAANKRAADAEFEQRKAFYLSRNPFQVWPL